ncbi:sigma-70 family RNA polymerase sigma factor [Arthrobacter sp. NPDC090010]|uniref:sigma-70 family RNA polymerase sigma factor n=1 Tax=Arthrobacter sp. NPDC090010 TaxID=3363942 RepID=UPI003806AE63
MSDDALVSDGELCLLVREGDADAFGVLYERHAPLAKAIARQSVDNENDAEDVVSDAFQAVLTKLRDGDGPDTFFRAYLLQVVRRTAYARNRSASRALPTGDQQSLDRSETFDDPAIGEFENLATAKAFRALPQRWQEVLWYLDVEGQKPGAVAPVMGLAPNAVSALAVRARDALRREYLQAHVSEDVPERCRPYADKLGGYVHGNLSTRAERKVREHLDECARCTAIVVELGDVGASMKAVLLPLVIGIGPAAWWLSSAGQGAVLSSLSGVPAATGLLAGGAASSSASSAASSGGTATGAAGGAAAAGAGVVGSVAAVAAAAVVAVGLVLAPSIAASWRQQAPAAAPAPTASDPASPFSDGAAATPSASSSAPAKSSKPSVTLAPSQSQQTVMIPQPPVILPWAPPIASVPLPARPVPSTPASTASPSSTPTPSRTATPSPSVTPTTTGSPSPSVTTATVPPSPTETATPTPTVTTATVPPTETATPTPSPTVTPCQPWWHPNCWFPPKP